MPAAPPGLAVSGAGARRNDVGGKGGAVSHALVAQLVAVARRDMAVIDLHLSANKLSRVVRAYLASGQERDLVSYVVGYADPTGEQAVRNVMRAGRS